MTNEEKIYQVLDDLHIAYERLDHEPISSVIEAAEKGIVLPGQQVKNLVWKCKKDKELEELLQVEPGAVTPFGLLFDKEKKVQLIVDEEVDPSLTVGFHPFVNSTTLNIAYSDFLRLLEKTGHAVKRVNC